MDDASDILTRPLGLAEPAAKRRLPAILARGGVPGRILAGIVFGALVAAAGGLALFGDPQGGEPRASAVIAIREPAPPAAVAALPQPEEGPIRHRSAQEVEQASGVTVTRPAGADGPAVSVIIGVPSSQNTGLAKAPDPRLVERGRHGPIPKIGEGRARPLDVYARTDLPDGAGARIAILVSGIGVSDLATATAITRLPAAVSLGVSPYGQEADKNAARARLAGHEILLQLPMEPFDYPDSDPGPQTLLTTARAPENLDRLSWAMSRFPGFVGIVNFMGAKFTSDAGAFEPVLREIGARGLGFVDDGTSARSLIATLSPKVKVPAMQAEVVIDAVQRPEAIDRELARLEALARKNGFTFGTASAQAMTIERIARWARELDAKGIRLVPVSAALRGLATTRVSSAGQ